MKKKKATIVKTNRTKEAFNNKKLYASIYSSCLSAQLPKKECQRIAKKIYADVVKILSKQQCLLSEEVSATVTKAMAKHQKELAFMYKTHKDLS